MTNNKLNTEKISEQGENLGDFIVGWQIHEYEKHTRGKLWYLIFGFIALGFLILCLITPNFAFESPNIPFAFIIILSAFIIIINDARDPVLVDFTINTEGIIIGRKFYDYDKIKNFAILYKPGKDGPKKLYFQFKNSLKPVLIIELLDNNPLYIREILLQYLLEDLEKDDESLAEVYGRFFKI